MNRLHFPAREQFTRDESREMAAALNMALKLERSRISTRERQRLDEIADAKQQQRCSPDLVLRHPKYIQLVENSDSELFIGKEKIDYGDLLERSIKDSFDYKYFSQAQMNAETKDFCFLLKVFDAREWEERLIGIEINAEGETTNLFGKGAQQQPLSELIINYLAGVYKRVFDLDPYLGGVGPNEEHRKPNSPFGVFAKFVLDGLDIKTRNGSRYSLPTIKNCMPSGSIRASRHPDEPELVAARDELLPKRGRGRPRKEGRSLRVTAAPETSSAGPGSSNGTPETN